MSNTRDLIGDALRKHFENMIMGKIRIAPDGQLLAEERDAITRRVKSYMRSSGYELRAHWTLDVWLEQHVLRVLAVDEDGKRHDAQDPAAWEQLA